MQKTQTICLLVLTAIGIGFSLFYLKTVLLPFVIALFIVIGCHPILDFIQKRLRLHRMIAFAVSFLIGVIILAALSLMIWSSVDNLSRNTDAYKQRLDAIVTWASDRFLESDEQDGQSEENDSQNPADPSEQKSPQPNDSQQTETESGDAPANPSKQALSELLTSASGYLQSFLLELASSLSALLSYGVLILIFVFFLLFGDTETSANRPRILVEVEEQVRKYLVMKTLISAVTGFVFGLVLWLFGVPLAIVFGVLAFLLNFIPNIGPLVAIILPVPFLVLSANISPLAAIICLILISTIQFVSGNVIETKMMGKSFDVSPVVLLLALMFFGLVWGIVGMFLATPIISIIKIVLQQSESGKPLAELIAGRWTGWNSGSAANMKET